jgi:arsenate reductase
MISIYHNPRCSKSRQGLALLEASGKEFEIINYLEDKLTVLQLDDIISKLAIEPLELIRKNEAIWKSEYKGKTLSNKKLIEAMVKYPKLIERPIVVHNNKAVIGRPAENILSII